MLAHLVLEDGSAFSGRSVGAPGVAAGEACFTTAPAGYEQAVTDPSYARQVLAFAYPLIGNYGVDERLLESDRVWTEGVVMRRARPEWASWLAARGVVALEEIDTRALVRRLRDDGAMRCALGTASVDELHARALAQPHLDWPRMLAEPELASPAPALEACTAEPYSVGAGPRVVVLDLGCKRSIVRRLVESGVRGDGRPRHVGRRRGAGARAGGGADRQRSRRPVAARRAGRHRPRPARPRAAVRNLPRPPARRARARPEHVQASVRPPGRQPPGARDRLEPGARDRAEPRLRGRARRRRRGEPRLAQRRHRRRARGRGLRDAAVPSRGRARAARRPSLLRPDRRGVPKEPIFAAS